MSDSDNKNNNGWKEWSNHVLKELERLNDTVESVKNEVKQTQIDIATLKVKASMWGGLSGILGAIGSMLIYYLTKVIK